MDPQSLFNRLRTAAAALSTRQLITLAVAFVAVVGITIGSAYWLNRTEYDVLFSNMEPDAAATIVERLKASKIEYVLEDRGRTVRVPEGRVDEMRLKVASDGMPSSGRGGFEILDKTAFGTTDFMEKVNYQRALEGELARTIGTLSEVASARVHIAMPQPGIFMGNDKPATASVVLKLKGNTQLSASTVSAITGLVSASVESLRPESVVVIDNFGRPLARPQDDSDTSLRTAVLDEQRRIEQDLSTKLVALLEPIVGPGRARVNVTALVNTSTQERTEEAWDPNPVKRSEQTVTQSVGTGGANPGGLAGVTGTTPAVAGARANAPAAPASGTPAPPPPPQPGSSASASQTVNYEVSKTTVRTIVPQGQVTRLSVAVLLDNDRAAPAPGTTTPGAATPRNPEELTRIRGLVAATVGFDEKRGDQLTVENVAFEEPPAEEPPVELPIWKQYQEQGFEALRIVATLIIALLAMVLIVRPMVRGAMPPPSAPEPAALGAGGPTILPVHVKTVQEIEAEIDAEIEAAVAGASKRLPALTNKATALTKKEPENAARLLRAWLTEEER